MTKPSEKWKKNRAYTEEVSKILIESGNMDRQGVIRGWLGKKQYIAMQKIGHSSIDFNNCRCNNEIKA